jgi:membrane-associated phospholipid phosphatase
VNRQKQASYRPLTGRWRIAAVLVGIISAAGVAGLAIAYWHEVSPGRLDAALLRELSPSSVDMRDLLGYVELLGDWRVVAVLTAAVSLVAMRYGGPRASAFSAAAPIIAAAASELVLKPFVGRRLDGDLAFPSGHTTGITAVAAVVVILVIALGRPGTTAKIILIASALVVVVAVCFALAALGDHYATDAIGGALVAAGVVSLVALVFDFLSVVGKRS